MSGYIGSKRSSSLVSFDEGAIGSGVVFPVGHVIQVKQFLYTHVYEINISGSSVFLPAPLGDGSAYIQMGSSSNKVLITIQLHYGHESNWRSNFAQLYTNNFTSTYDTGSETLITGSGNAGTAGSSTTHFGGNTITSSILYSPNTTNKAGFRIKVSGHNDGGNLHLNQNNQNNSSANNNTFSISSSITLQEISS